MDPVIIVIIAVAALAALALPLLGGSSRRPVDEANDLPLEAEIARYRVAVRSDTLCARCGQANPADAKYCYECGRTLPKVDAQEFDGTGEAA